MIIISIMIRKRQRSLGDKMEVIAPDSCTYRKQFAITIRCDYEEKNLSFL